MLNDLEIIGAAIIGGLAVTRLFGVFRLPAVAGYVVLGVLLGPSVTEVFPKLALDRLDLLADLALGVVAFTIGGELQWINIRRIAGSVVPIVMLESLGAMAIVTPGILWVTGDWPLALILGSISAATAPAATVMVIHEMKAKGTLTSTLLAVVGIDDAISLTLFALASAIAKALLQSAAVFSLAAVALEAGRAIGGALLLGSIGGLIAGHLIRRIEVRESAFSLAIGGLVLNAGIATHFHLSALLVNMAFGMVIANVTPISSRRLFEQVGSFSGPLFIAFFVIAGAHLRIDLLPALGLAGSVYLLARSTGKMSGAYLGAAIARTPKAVRNNIGFGLLSQVGVAIGLSLVVANDFGNLGEEGAKLAVTVINVLLGTTLVTEVIGPMLTRFALRRAGEANQANH